MMYTCISLIVHPPFEIPGSAPGDNSQIASIAGPGKADISAVPNTYQTINSCYGKGAATVNT